MINNNKKRIGKKKRKKERQCCPKKKQKNKKTKTKTKTKQNKSNKKRQQGSVLLTRGEEKKGNLKKPMCMCTWAFLTIKKNYLHSVFSLLWEENILVGLRRRVSQFIFHPFYPTKHTLKKFSFSFSLQSFPPTLFHRKTNTT